MLKIEFINFQIKIFLLFFHKFKKLYKKEQIDIAHVRGVISFQHIIWFCLLNFSSSEICNFNQFTVIKI